MLQDFESLPKPTARSFVPKDLPFTWEALRPVFAALESRGIVSTDELERWIEDEGELDSVLYEQRAIRYINYTRQTDNVEFSREYELYTNELEPKLKVAGFGLLKKFIDSPFRKSLPQATYALEDKRRAAIMRIYRPANVGLERDESNMAQEYQKTIGAMTVQFRGEERTMQQMSKFYEEPDRAVREEAWRLADARALKDAAALDLLYSKMVAVRDSIARNAGFPGYREYVFSKKFRFDYTADDCLEFHRAVQRHMVPLSRELDKIRMDTMEADSLKPWDLRVDPKGRPPLSPFADSSVLVRGCAMAFSRMDPQLSSYFSSMQGLGLLDLESRKGKAPGGYQEELTESELPFIFMNAAGRDSDVRTLFHECGHAFHTFLIRDAGLPFFNGGTNVPTEFAEVASMSMELMGGEHLNESFYDGPASKRSNREELESIVKLFAWVATIDSFQHWVYANPRHTIEERSDAWRETFMRFCGLETYDGLDDSLSHRWQRQLHLFEVPFYYIEYGIASIGALGIWLQYRRDRRDGIENYKSALSLGASRSLPDLFGAAGLEWGIGESSISRLATELREAIRSYE